MLRSGEGLTPPSAGSGGGFDAALAGEDVQLVNADGQVLLDYPRRWHQTASGADGWLLDRCIGPTVDLGCGPGRLPQALAARSVPSLGVDHCPIAVAVCKSRGVRVSARDVFARLPGEGRWHHALLADGNIGIGGDPVALLARCARLIRPGGSLLVEAHCPVAFSTPGRGGLWSGAARLRYRHGGQPAGAWFPWAVIALDPLINLAASLGWTVIDVNRGRRCFAQLRRPH